MRKIGYTTGTFDLVHDGHFKFLRNCKLFCEKLIVGLVTDELGKKQKRQPVLDYNHRRSVLENCKWVDSVVEHRGLSKQDDYKKLNFDILLIADDYFGSEEYSSFKRDYPNVPVIYIPRTSNISTSEIFEKLTQRVISESKIRDLSISGEILDFSTKKDRSLIVKTVKIGVNEFNSTANCYNLIFPPPRNWKMISPRTTKTYPLISGINSNRELSLHSVLKGKSWYPGIEVMRKFYNISSQLEVLSDIYDVRIKQMNEQRRFPKEIFWILQRDGGMTLLEWAQDKNFHDRGKMYERIYGIINEMREIGMMHMDLHPRNILVDKDEEISVIDYGWSMHTSFEMDEMELSYFNDCFAENFDKKHFDESLRFYGIDKYGVGRV